jgi:hypothetical protein
MKKIIKFGLLTLALFIFAACANPFDPSAYYNELGNNGVVRIYIGENSQQSRTVQPGLDAIAGYQLTFTGGTHDPVDITGVNYADITLEDGEWTITATAYKKDGEIGNNDDSVASGSISITISNGAVSGSVPSIILRPLTVSDGEGGTLHYDITLDYGVSGYLKLWEIDGISTVSAFGTSGVLTINNSTADDFTYTAGRYIIEVKLTSGSNIAFRREVIEIWEGTITAFVFAPDEYLDPSAVLANSEAALSEADTKINDKAIGIGTGSGINEQNPKTYTFRTANAGNVSITFAFELDSIGATYSWALNTGDVPDVEYSTETLPTDFSTNNVLWVKAVSEDGGKTVYYKFAIVPPPPPSYKSPFTDADYNPGRISGTINWNTPANDYLSDITGYRIYYGRTETEKFDTQPVYPLSGVISKYTESQTVDSNTVLPTGVKFFLIYSCNATGDYSGCLAIPIIDLAIDPGAGGFGAFTVTGTVGISYSSPYLTITQSGFYYITGDGTETTDCIRVSGSNIIVNIVLKDANINVSGTANTVAFDANQNNDEGVTVNLTLEGTNTLRSGNDKAGLHVPSNTTIDISGGGTLNAAGGSNGAGIGGNNNEAAGSITINDCTVTASGGQYGAGIGGGQYGSGGTVTINGGTVTATGQYAGAGIGGGNRGAGGTVTINGGTIIANGGTYFGLNGSNYYDYGGAGIGGSVGSSGTVTINGGTVTATGGSTGAGIGSGSSSGDYGTAGGTVTINGGTVIATGGGYTGAGIGGGGVSGYNSTAGAGGTVTINGGTVTATGGSYSGAGIGGGGKSGTQWGYGGAGGTVTINGGTVTANGGSNGAGIGGGGGLSYGGGASGTVTINNNAVIFASFVQPTLTDGGNVNDAIVFNGNNGTVYGDFILSSNLTITNDKNLTIPAGKRLTIPGNVTLQNNGIIFNSGTVIGNISGNQPVQPPFVISGSTMYTYEGRVLTITGDGTYTISMRSGLAVTTTDNVVVASGVTADITLSGVNINSGVCAFDMTRATVNLTLVGANVLRSGNDRAGLAVPTNSTLVITEESTGSLTATGGNNSAGIGGGNSGAGGTVTISGGTVTAIGGNTGAGIGGGFNSAGGTVTISGGTVTATGGESGAGIGGGNSGAGGMVTINDGTVTATGGNYGGAGIGGGRDGAGGTVIINGGTVTGTGGYNGAGIGGGNSNSGSSYGAGGTVTISGGTVTATGGQYGGAGIGGGGNYGSAGSIDISDDAVIFASSIQPTLIEGDNVDDSIIFIGNTGTLYGNVTLGMNVTFAAGRVLTISSGKSLSIPDSVTLTNNGTINVESGGTVTGTVTGNQPVFE